MKSTIQFTLMLLTVFTTLSATSQNDSILLQEEIMDQFINRLEEISDNEIVASEELIEELQEQDISSKPNLNALSYETAVKVLHLSDYQYYQLQLYIENYGQLVSVYELSAIDGFTRSDMEYILSKAIAIPLSEKGNFFKDFFTKSRVSLFTRYGQVLEKQAGYDTSRSNHYEGSPGHACFRINFETQDRLFIKIAGEKDAGECFFRNKQKYGFDLYSGSLSVKRMGIVTSAVLGDYRLNFGQGLVLGSSLLSGKGGGVNSIRRFSSGIRAVALTNESDALRGGAVTLGNSLYSGTLFLGRQLGTMQNSAGFNFGFRHEHFTIGARIVGYSITDTNSNVARWRSSFLPNALNASIDYHAIIRKLLAAGEVALNEQARIALLQTFIFNVSPTSRLAIVFRHYNKGYSASLGNAFGASSNNAGETGVYLTSSTILSRRSTLDLYCDCYRLTWLTYRTDSPVSGMDAGITWHFDISRRSALHLNYYWKSKPENDPESTWFKRLREHNKHRIRLQWSNTPLEQLKLTTEISWICNYYPMMREPHSGLLLYQDAAISLRKPDIAIHLRIAYFDTDRYDERLYAYEDDVYYAFTIGSYYYKGIRGYLVLRYKSPWFSVWLRLSQTYYINRSSISSGLTLIDKPHKTELKLQFQFTI